MAADSWLSLQPALSQTTLGVLEELGFTYATPVQETAIPLFLSNKDVAAEAVTGSGKTLAFVIPIIEIILKQYKHQKWKTYDVLALIITPTRELAVQINEVLSSFTKHYPAIKQSLMIGGTNPQVAVKKFKQEGGNIIIGTPGRLDDIFSHKPEGLDLGACVKTLEVLVLDEADRLLDMGFEKSINNILGFLPKQRRTGLFSATQTDELEALVRAGLRNPIRITVREKVKKNEVTQRTPASLENFYMVCNPEEKVSKLVAFLNKNKDKKVIVFLSTCASVDYFVTLLDVFLKGVDVTSLHGKMKHKRYKIFDAFRKQSRGILVCTDVMARGVDIPEVNWVVQFDPPSNASAFVHRCGRTARFGKQGNALLFLLSSEDSYVEFLSINQKVKLELYNFEETVIDVIPKLRQLAVRDRAIYERGIRAFVSFIKSYSKHQCSLIFNLKELDIGKLAYGYGLLKLPRMPELRGREAGEFPSEEIDIDSIAYKDKAREKKRQLELEERKTKEAVFRGKTREQKRAVNSAWSKKKEKSGKKVKKKTREKLMNMRDGGSKRKAAAMLNDSEMDELAKEASLVKKLKAGRISKSEFEQQVNDGDSDDAT